MLINNLFISALASLLELFAAANSSAFLSNAFSAISNNFSFSARLAALKLFCSDRSLISDFRVEISAVFSSINSRFFFNSICCFLKAVDFSSSSFSLAVRREIKLLISSPRCSEIARAAFRLSSSSNNCELKELMSASLAMIISSLSESSSCKNVIWDNNCLLSVSSALMSTFVSDNSDNNCEFVSRSILRIFPSSSKSL